MFLYCFATGAACYKNKPGDAPQLVLILINCSVVCDRSARAALRPKGAVLLLAVSGHNNEYTELSM
jgi:hypothetical protein